MGYLYIFLTILFTVYGQIILKVRINALNWSLDSSSLKNIIASYFNFFIDPFILSGFTAAFLASFFWTLAMSKFEITFAYPFMSLSPSLVFIIGMLFLNETFTWGKVIGLLLIIIGIIVTVKL